MKEQSKKQGITAGDVSGVLQGLLQKRKFRFGMIFDSWDLCKSKAKCRSVMRRDISEIIKEFNQSLVNRISKIARASPAHSAISVLK